MLIREKTEIGELDYIFDWAPMSNGRGQSDWLAVGEQISSYVVTVETGVTNFQNELVDGSTAVRVWLSGGTRGISYTIRCEITTNTVPPRIDAREFLLKVIP